MATPAASRATLAVVVRLLRVSDLSARRRQEMIAAINTVARAIGRPTEAILVDLRTLNSEIQRVLPAAARISDARWRNVVSLLRSALRITGREIRPDKSAELVSPAWTPVFERLLTSKDRYSISPLVRWLSARNITPADVGLTHIEGYKREVSETALTVRVEEKLVEMARAWNRSVKRVPGWPQLPIALPSKRRDFSMPWSAFPLSLLSDVDG